MTVCLYFARTFGFSCSLRIVLSNRMEKVMKVHERLHCNSRGVACGVVNYGTHILDRMRINESKFVKRVNESRIKGNDVSGKPLVK